MKRKKTWAEIQVLSLAILYYLMLKGQAQVLEEKCPSIEAWLSDCFEGD